MARLKNGYLGGFSGRLGDAVGYMIGDEAFIRSAPRAKKYTAAERVNQDKFKLVTEHLKGIKPILKVGFKGYWTKTGGYRAAVSYTRKVALVMDDAGFYIDPALFKISGGDLPGAENAEVVYEESLRLRINWDISNLQPRTHHDQLMLMVRETESLESLAFGLNGPFRKDGTFVIDLRKSYKGKKLDVYIGFVAADRSRQSDSQYLGRIEIPA